MADILNMENLRDIIDHDKELERELIQNFHNCYLLCISELELALKEAEADTRTSVVVIDTD
ncbi:MAG: hypothetical protein K2Q32_05530, partial [Alphaproteobacteria bacterium]|nr:hypothetical protein [Alphaproteobacteria bacterium]